MRFLGIGRRVEVDGGVVSDRVPANSYMPYDGRVGICSMPVEW